ncbi:MAG TPA: histidine kinase [Chitinophagaceae bacterium]|nr:histidine kinase [Chitinophagaceae bacterium]
MFSHKYRYLFIILLSLYTFLNTVLCDVYHYFNINIEWFTALATIFFITFLTWESNRLVEPFFKKRFLNHNNKVRYLITFFIAGSIFTFIVTVGTVVIIGNLIHGYSIQQNINPIKLNLIYGSLINLFFHLLNAIFFFFKEYRRHLAEAEEFKKVSTQAEIQLIKNQVNPHFLFNNLNVLSGMVIRDNPEANQFIEEFSKVYRYILSTQDKELVPLQSELEFVQPYIFLLKKRFNNALEVNIDVPDFYKSWHIVPASLQMLIENAIKHNVVSHRKPLRIEIHVNGNHTLVIKNNLQPRKNNERSTKIGLQNISRRYELICGKTVMVNKSDDFFAVDIPMLNLN